jgi:uncharacterized protein YjbI with pentapeptide repeats
MAAPAGVNEGLPQEPAKAGGPGAGLAEAQVAGAAPGGDVADTAAAGPSLEEPAPTAADRAEAEHAEADAAEAEPAETDAAGADRAGAGLAGAGLAGAGLAGAGLAGAGLAGAGLAGAGLAGEGGDAEQESRDVSPLAVAGIILGVIALVGVAVGVLAVVTHGFRPKTVVTYRPAAVFGLRPGQCIDSGANALTVTVLSCGGPHDAEVFATFSLPAAAWPGTSAVQLDASNGCVSRFDSYLNPQLATADLTQEYIYPNRAAWQAGERTVVCEVRAVSGQLSGSVRAKG